MGETVSANKPRRSTRASPPYSNGNNSSTKQSSKKQATTKQTTHTKNNPRTSKTTAKTAVPKRRGQKRKVIESSPSDNDDDDDDDYDDNSRAGNGGNSPPTHNDGVDDELGNVPTAMLAKYAGTTSIASYPALVAHHRKLFMQRAFNQSDTQDEDVDNDNEMRKSSLRSEEELQNICFILKHWGGNQNLKLLKDDMLLKKLIKFRRAHPVGKHHITKYHYNTITLPSGEKRNILRRIEKGKTGRIVVSRERVFDAINEWHRSGSGHFGSERTWML
jgi:hypothetical protein